MSETLCDVVIVFCRCHIALAISHVCLRITWRLGIWVTWLHPARHPIKHATKHSNITHHFIGNDDIPVWIGTLDMIYRFFSTHMLSFYPIIKQLICVQQQTIPLTISRYGCGRPLLLCYHFCALVYAETRKITIIYQYNGIPRYYSPPARWGLLDFMSTPAPPPSPLSPSPLRLLRLGPQPRPATPSVRCRTSTTTSHAQCSLPDLNHDHPRPVFAAGPQPRPSTPSVRCRTSTTTIHAQCSLPDLNRQKICQIECQKIWQIECQKIWQIECQKICQIECQIERQIQWQIERQIQWQIECQRKMPDKNAR